MKDIDRHLGEFWPKQVLHSARGFYPPASFIAADGRVINLRCATGFRTSKEEIDRLLA